MPKLWFLDYLGKYVNKQTMREMCERMELDEMETRLVLERFCGRKNMGQCDFIPEDQQKSLLPSLDVRVQGWVERHKDHFLLVELHPALKFFDGKGGTV